MTVVRMPLKMMEYVGWDQTMKDMCRSAL